MEIDSSVHSKVTALFSGNPQTIHDALGIAFKKLSKNEVQATMPVDERTRQPFGILHGGASVVLAESCASIGAWLNIDENKYNALGIEINANHLRSVTQGIVTASATPQRLGKRIQVWNISITDEDQNEICISRCTIAVVEK
jgi:1,4-dihydroxy-2-naphthoyl-CoA hydrolase